MMAEVTWVYRGQGIEKAWKEAVAKMSSHPVSIAPLPALGGLRLYISGAMEHELLLSAIYEERERMLLASIIATVTARHGWEIGP